MTDLQYTKKKTEENLNFAGMVDASTFNYIPSIFSPSMNDKNPDSLTVWKVTYQ